MSCVRWIVCEMSCVRWVVWDELCVRWIVWDELCVRWIAWDELCEMSGVRWEARGGRRRTTDGGRRDASKKTKTPQWLMWGTSENSHCSAGDVYVLSKAPGWNVSVGWDEVDMPKAKAGTSRLAFTPGRLFQAVDLRKKPHRKWSLLQVNKSGKHVQDTFDVVLGCRNCTGWQTLAKSSGWLKTKYSSTWKEEPPVFGICFGWWLTITRCQL